jgi:uncharacterized Tic20 family protein
MLKGVKEIKLLPYYYLNNNNCTEHPEETLIVHLAAGHKNDKNNIDTCSKKLINYNINESFTNINENFIDILKKNRVLNILLIILLLILILLMIYKYYNGKKYNRKIKLFI